MNCNSKGFFLCLEGIDGSGKTTQREMIVDWFRKHNIDPLVTREPGGTVMAEEIREVLLKGRDEIVHGRTEALLFYAARVQHVENVIRPALEAGRVVVCDRFYHSTYAYQAAGRGIRFSEMDKLHSFALGEMRPDKVFYYSIDPAVARERLKLRGGLNRLDTEKGNFYEACETAFQRLCLRDIGEGSSWEIIVADMDEDQVFAQTIPYLTQIVNHIKVRPSHR